MVVHSVLDGCILRPGGDDESGYPESAQLMCKVGVGRVRWWYVLKKTAPLVVLDDEQRVRPVLTGGRRVVDPVEEGLAVADVRERVIVAGESELRAEESWLDETYVGERAGGRRTEECWDRGTNGEVLRAPEREKGHIAEKVATTHPAGKEEIP